MNFLIPGSIAHICHTFANSCYKYLNNTKTDDLNEGFSNSNNNSILALLIIFSIIIIVILLYSLLYVPLKYNKQNNNNNKGVIFLLILGFLFLPLINIITFAVMVNKNMKN